MTPARCERSREWISLRLDGMLSSFEEALLDRHLAGCPSCNAFATAATAETTLLRAADLEELPAPVVLPRSAPHPLRRSASGLAAAALAAVAAALTVGGGGVVGTQQHSGAAARAAAASGPMIVVVAAQSSAGPTSVEVPRLHVQSVSVADLPVHGKFNDPVLF